MKMSYLEPIIHSTINIMTKRVSNILTVDNRIIQSKAFAFVEGIAHSFKIMQKHFSS